VILIVVPYIYSSVAVVKVVFDHVGRGRTFSFFKVVALAAVCYCLWTIMGGDPKTVMQSLVGLLLSVPLYPFFIASMQAAAERKQKIRMAAAAQ